MSLSLSLAEAEALFGQMLDGAMADHEIAATLVEMAERGESAEEVAGAALAMRARMKRIAAPANAIDVATKQPPPSLQYISAKLNLPPVPWRACGTFIN